MRGWLALGLLLVPIMGEATIGWLAWDYPLDQPPTTFVADITMVVGGRVVVRREALQAQPAAQCARANIPDVTPQTRCAEICLDSGEYTITVTAIQGPNASDPSTPPLDLDGVALAPCRPITLVQQPPKKQEPSKASTVAGGVATVAVVGGPAVLLNRSAVSPSIPALPNLGCVSWKVTGPCVCGFPPHPCLTVEYYEPGWIVETVKRPGTTALDVLAPLLDAALQGTAALPTAGGGAGNAIGGGHTNLHFSEAHVWTYPQPLGGPCTACAPGNLTPTLHYASELDTPGWRLSKAVPSPLDVITRVLTWGPLYPRIGFGITGSPPVASGLASARAMDIAFQPVGTPPNLDTHVVPVPTGSTSRCMQLAWPKQTPCMTAGTPPPLWETGSVSPNGNYVWVIWRRRTCCVNPAMTTCGITLPGVGGQGANWCLLPTPPSP